MDGRDLQVNMYPQVQKNWIENVFEKRECVVFVSSSEDPKRCCCGRKQGEHGEKVGSANIEPNLTMNLNADNWSPSKHTEASPTDAYGIIEFQGGAHPIKAQYLRLSYDTRSELVIQLLTRRWELELPKLLISVHGGRPNFELQPKLKKVLNKGLLKAAKTTGAWIFTGGTNTGVNKHVGEAFGNERSPTLRGRVVTIGITPWGIVQNKQDLIGKEITVQYHSISNPKRRLTVLNNRHAYFLLVDNGTVEKYGAEIALRKKLEKYISRQKILTSSYLNGGRASLLAGNLLTAHAGHRNLVVPNRGKDCNVPVVGLIIEGGKNTIRTVLEYVTDSPPVPVVICDGSGRAADLLAFTYKYIDDDGNLNDLLRGQLLVTVKKIFDCQSDHAERLVLELIQCVKRKELITIFRMGEGPCQELDQAILSALLKGSRLNAPDQLSLALTWNRVDIARAEIFVYGQEWKPMELEQAMMDALVNDSVDFTKLLLENGLNIAQFLTISRLQELYNTKHGPSNNLKYIFKDLKKNVPPNYQFMIYDIGLIIQKLMGCAYACEYCRRRYRVPRRLSQHASSENHGVMETPLSGNCPSTFMFPYNELLVWAVLMKRQKMALFMWQQGEEAIAKSLVAIKLYKAMAHEAAQDDLETAVSDECLGYAREFEQLSLDLLDYCYKQSNEITQQILTCELQNWGKQTCITLAAAAKHMEFLAHPCCQIILANLWLGGMRMRRNTNLKVLLGLLFPPFVFSLEFKSKEELQLMPKTEEAHRENLESLDDINSVDENGNKDTEIGEYTDSNASHQSIHRMKKDENGANFSQDSFSSSSSDALRASKKLQEFYNAPITKFWAHMMAYMVFLTVYTYVVITKLPPEPSWCEWYVFAFIVVWGAEKVGELKQLKRASFSRRCALWLEKKLNVSDMMAILLFILGFSMRHALDNHIVMTGRVLLCIDIAYWYLRICDFLSVTKYFGPVITMIGKMIVHMSYFVVLLIIVLMAFGVVQQSILFPNEEANWHSVRDIFYKPYFMVYGELFASEIHPSCGEDLEVQCVPGRWLVPIFMSAYLLIADILLVNLVIAIFNNVFMKVNAIAHQVWKFQRFTVVMEYEQKPFLPPPLTILYHLYTLYKYCVKGKRDVYDNSLKLFLCEEVLEQVRDYEEDCIEGYIQEKDMRYKMTSEHLVRNVYRRTESDAQKLEDLRQRETSVSNSIQGVNVRLAKLEDVCEQAVNTMAVIHRFMATQGNTDREYDEEMLLESNALLTASSDTVLDDQMYMYPGFAQQDDDVHSISDEDGNATVSLGQISVGGIGNNCTGSIRSDAKSIPNSQHYLATKKKSDTKEGSIPNKKYLSVKHLTVKSPSRSVPNSAYNSRRYTNLSVERMKFKDRPPVTRPRPLRALSVRGPKKLAIGLERRTQSLAHLPNPVDDQVPKGFELIPSIKVRWEEPSIQIIPPTPTIAATKHEYTSITDEIESFIPRLQNSPTKSNASGSGHKQQSGKVQAARSNSLSDTEQAILAERENLWNAEDNDYQLMESLIQRRLHRDSRDLAVSLEDLCSIGTGSGSGSSVVNVHNQQRVVIIETKRYEITPDEGLDDDRC